MLLGLSQRPQRCELIRAPMHTTLVSIFCFLSLVASSGLSTTSTAQHRTLIGAAEAHFLSYRGPPCHQGHFQLTMPRQIFKNKVIAAAGPLPGSLTVENLKRWTSIRRGQFVDGFDETVTHLLCTEEQFNKRVPRGAFTLPNLEMFPFFLSSSSSLWLSRSLASNVIVSAARFNDYILTKGCCRSQGGAQARQPRPHCAL